MRKALAPYLKPSKLIHYGIWAFLIFLLAQRIPAWIANYKVEGADVPAFPVIDQNNLSQSLPAMGQKQIIIFWATWCKPCELELSRFNKAVAEGEIKAESVRAVSIGEDPAVVFAAAKERAYTFSVYADPEGLSAQSLTVQATPQVYHVDGASRVAYASMGVSPLTILRAKWFLRD